jgi:hypothetical protein
MKIKIGIIISCIGILLSSYSFASCGGSGDSYDGSDYYTSRCQCASDPNCAKRVDTDCISESACCQAFGNIGAR